MSPHALPKLTTWLFPLRLTGSAAHLVVYMPRSRFVWEGLTSIVMGPFAVYFLALILVGMGVEAGLIAEQGEDRVEGVLFALAHLGSAAFILTGFVVILLSGYRSRRSRIVFDLVKRTVKGKTAEVPFHAIGGVRLRKVWIDVSVLELVDRNGAPLMTLHRRLRGWQARDVDAVTRVCTEALNEGSAGAPVPLPAPAGAGAKDRIGLEGNVSAMLCYLPIEGIFLLASFYYLATEKTRPLVRFAAIQSLAHLLFVFSVLMACLAAFIPLKVMDLLDDTGDMAFLAFGITLAFWNFGVRVLASVRAYKNVVWVMPWLRPFLKNSVPPS